MDEWLSVGDGEFKIKMSITPLDPCIRCAWLSVSWSSRRSSRRSTENFDCT